MSGRLFYNWNRYYDPTTGRYVEADPIGLDGGLNIYEYTRNMPGSKTDPKGLFTSAIHMMLTSQSLQGSGLDPAAINAATYWGIMTDFVNGSQDPAQAAWHAMANGLNGESQSQAYQNYTQWVESRIATCTGQGLGMASTRCRTARRRGIVDFTLTAEESEPVTTTSVSRTSYTTSIQARTNGRRLSSNHEW